MSTKPQLPPNSTIVITDEKESYSYAKSKNEFIPKTIGDLLNDSASSNEVAYIFAHEGVELTLKDVYERVNLMSQNLLDLGFVKGDRIAIILPNTHNLLIVYLASSQIGLISTILSPVDGFVELQYKLKKINPKGIVLYDSFQIYNHIDIITKICPELNSSVPGEIVSDNLSNLKHVFILQNPSNRDKKLYTGTWEFEKLTKPLPNEISYQLPDVKLEDPNLILYTSGTSGRPKAAVINQMGFLETLLLHSNDSYDKPKMFNLIPLKLFHIWGVTSGLIAPLIPKLNVSVVIPDYFYNIEATIKALEKYKCSFMPGNAHHYYDIINYPKLKNYDISSMKICIVGGSYVSPSLIASISDCFNTKLVFVGLGMTELSGVHSAVSIYDIFKGPKYAIESCGRVMASKESKIVDINTGKTQLFDTDGELYVRGSHVIKEYWDDPEKTAKAIDKDGWFKTGDIFSMNSEGYLYFKSRRNDVIVNCSLNIYPAEIENYLKTHGDVLAAEAFGVPDERTGEETCVWIIKKKESTLTEEDVKMYCKGKVADYKIPRYVKFVNDFPVSVHNKAMKSKMKEISIINS